MDLGKKKRRMPTIWCGSLPVASLLCLYFSGTSSPLPLSISLSLSKT
jgi:hypothetical protein